MYFSGIHKTQRLSFLKDNRFHLANYYPTHKQWMWQMRRQYIQLMGQSRGQYQQTVFFISSTTWIMDFPPLMLLIQTQIFFFHKSFFSQIQRMLNFLYNHKQRFLNIISALLSYFGSTCLKMVDIYVWNSFVSIMVEK